MRRYPVTFSLLVLLSAAGCSGEMNPGTATPVSPVASSAPSRTPSSPAGGEISLHLEPKEIVRGTAVHLSAKGISLPEAAIEWLVNGKVVSGSGGTRLDTANLRRNDTIQAMAKGAWGTAGSEIVTVGNSPPEIRRIRFVPPDRRTGSPLGVEPEGFDPDGDEVRFEIAWRKNGEPAGDGNRLQAPVRRGDKVTVTVVPFDGVSRGAAATLSREIANQVVIEGKEQFLVSENVVTFRVLASDDAGARLTYSLRSAPAGMRIDPATGWVRWETAPGTKGRIPFDVSVSDGAGAEATARFTVTIQEESPSEGR